MKERIDPAPLPTSVHAVARACAAAQCEYCYGAGAALGRRTLAICKCVFRSAFDQALQRYRQNEWKVATGLSPMARHYQRCHIGEAMSVIPRMPRSWSYPTIEYLADFIAIARRALQPASAADTPSARLYNRHWRIFKLHFMQGLDWKLCTRRLGIARGEFFHAVYRVKEICGRAFMLTRPWALFPWDSYFAPTPGDELSERLQPASKMRMPLRAPVTICRTVNCVVGEGTAAAA